MDALVDLKRVAIEHLPSGYSVYAVFFWDVTNTSFLQEQLISRNDDFEYAFINAAAVLSRTHVLAAVFRAVLSHVAGTLKTPNMHSEIVLSLGPSMNIAEAYRRFGIVSDTKNILIVKILHDGSSTQLADIWNHLRVNVNGVAMPFNEDVITKHSNHDQIRKYFKLGSVSSLPISNQANGFRALHEAELLALGAMALRGL